MQLCSRAVVQSCSRGTSSVLDVRCSSEGMLKLDRVLFSSVYYPADNGFIPQSYCEDKDPLDILIICRIDIVPLCIVPAR
jgi:inorganic pyrophosphatase